MAVQTYTVKRGDTLWGICTTYAKDISGNTTQAKINTLVKINNIKNPDLIFVNQVLKFSGDSSSGSTSGSTVPKKVTISGFGLQASAGDGSQPNRAMVVNWTWSRANTKNYKYRWTQYLNNKWVVGSEGDTTSYEDIYCQSTFTANANATKVRVQILPQSATYKSNNKDVAYWTDAQWSDVKEYDFSNNPPLKPPVPTIKIEDKTITMYIENIVASELDATGIKFNIVKDNTSSIYTSGEIKINTTSNYVSHQYNVAYGSSYTVRCCSVNSKGKTSGWSNFSASVGTRPSAPSKITTYRRNKRSDGSISAYLEWTAVPNAETYKVEYTTIRDDFDNGSGNYKNKTTEDDRTSIEITDIDNGHDYFFRVKAVNKDGESDPSPVVTIPIGEPPAAPTTWSSSESAFVGKPMELNWTHNSRDGSSQSWAQLSLKINDNDPVSYTFENTTNNTTGELTKTQTFTYMNSTVGTAISYKGELHVELNTSHASLKNTKIQWKVRTAGVTDKFSDTDWSIERTIYIYEEPTLVLSMVKDLATGSGIIQTLDSFPFYIRAEVDLNSYAVQKPIGYHLRVISNEFYETIDDAGQTKTINIGDAIYSKYFDTEDDLIVEMSANNLDLEPSIPYTVRCTATMSSGLTIDNEYEFSVNWVDVEYTVDATISVDMELYTATITPFCRDSSNNLVENIELAIYRRNYDGTLTEIAKNIPNNGTSVTDPHPALDYARYRLIARDTRTGAISFYDKAGQLVHGTAIIIQWDEEWSNFDINEENSVEGPAWSGSMLKLNYNVDITGKRQRDVEFVNYIGREHPVTYYGTHTGETATWNVVIPKDDTETIYALHRLQLWAGDVYVREPSGTGFWANVAVDFSRKHLEVTIPVTLNITRVEGGM